MLIEVPVVCTFITDPYCGATRGVYLHVVSRDEGQQYVRYVKPLRERLPCTLRDCVIGCSEECKGRDNLGILLH